MGDVTELALADGLALGLDEGVLTLTFNRPDRGNAVTAEMAQSLAGVFRAAGSDDRVRCVLVRGEGPNLSAGGDVAGFARTLELSADERSALFRGRLERAADMVRAVLTLDRPLVVVHRGAAAGAGLLFTLAADEVISDESASFVFAHQRVGLPPDGGVSFLLPRIVGWRAARRLVMGAARVTAQEALDLGLLDRILVEEEVEAEAARVTARFARAPQKALRSAKRLFNDPLCRALDLQLEAETAAIADAVGDEDFVEGVRAFVEKRRAEFPSTR